MSARAAMAANRPRTLGFVDLEAAELLRDRKEDPLLVVEVAIEGARADVRARDDVHDLSAVIAVLAEQLGCGEAS